MQEIFKDILGYEGIYQISNFGRVRSFKRKKEIILKNGLSNTGYLIVVLCKDIYKTFLVHHLVWDHFGNKPRKSRFLQVDHLDDNKQNNKINNLQLLTPRENTTKYHIANESTSKYVGVSWAKHTKMWNAQITIDGVNKNLGYYKNEYDAYLAYKDELCSIN